MAEYLFKQQIPRSIPPPTNRMRTLLPYLAWVQNSSLWRGLWTGAHHTQRQGYLGKIGLAVGWVQRILRTAAFRPDSAPQTWAIRSVYALQTGDLKNLLWGTWQSKRRNLKIQTFSSWQEDKPVRQTYDDIQNKPSAQWAKIMNRHFSKDNIWVHINKTLDVTNHQGECKPKPLGDIISQNGYW